MEQKSFGNEHKHIDPKFTHATVRLEQESILEKFDPKIDEQIEDYEFSIEETEDAEIYLTILKELGLLRHTAYIGNAYFIETDSKEHIEKFAELLKNKIKLKKTTITITYEDYPEWAEEEEQDD